MTRAGYVPDAQKRRDCPKCRYPMVQWAKFQRYPEKVWVSWPPDEWILPVHFLILGGLMLLSLTFPMLGAVFEGNQRSSDAYRGLEALVLAGATACAYGISFFRRRKRKQLAERLAPQAWVCARCLHAEHE